MKLSYDLLKGVVRWYVTIIYENLRPGKPFFWIKRDDRV